MFRQALVSSYMPTDFNGTFLSTPTSVEEPPAGSSRARRVSVGMALYAVIGGAISFAGWPFNIPRLTDWLGTGVSIQPNASVLLAVTGIALLLTYHNAPWRDRVVSALGVIIAAAGALTLSQYVVGADLGFNHQLLFGRTWGQATTATPGRVGPPASTSFILLGVALVMLGRRSPRAAVLRRRVAALSLAVCTLMLFGSFGYLFGARQFFAIPGLSAIALQTSSMLAALALALLAAVPEQEPVRLLRERSGTGALARIALPGLIILPPLIIWLRTLGFNLGYYDLGTSRALVSLLLVVANVALMWWALTKLRRREELERASDARLTGLLGSIGDALFSVDQHWRVTFVNDRALERLEVRREDLLGRPLWQFRPDLPASDARHQLYLAMTTRQAVEYEVYHPQRDQWLSERTYPTPDGGLTIYSIDITERKRTETAVRRSRERFRSLVGVITDVPWVADATGAFREPQREWEKYTGQTWEQHREFGWLDAIHPDDREPVRKTWLEACTSKTLYESRGRLWHASSLSWHHFVARATPLLEPDGSVREWVGSYTDVHTQVTADEALRSADRRKDEFLATLAHELRNPLAPVRNAVKILQLKGSQEPEVRWARDVIDRQMQHMSRLVDDLLDVSRISRGKIELRREQVELATILHGAIEATRPLIEERGHRFELRLPATPVYLNADLTRLAQVFSNLLNNAAKYTEPGGSIVVSADRQGSDVRVEIRDTGIGIPSEMRDQVFELFTQVGTSLERSSGGLGIGLTLVKRLVEMHGGNVEVQSPGLGKGSVFTVRLPVVVTPEASSGELADHGPLAPPAGRHVLIVDDNTDAAETLELIRTAMGWSTRTAHDGYEAIRVAREFRPDVVLLDIGLPRASGYDVARAIRGMPWASGAVIIALTGWGQQDDRRRSMEAGFDYHLVKPVSPDHLLRILASTDTTPKSTSVPGTA